MEWLENLKYKTGPLMYTDERVSEVRGDSVAPEGAQNFEAGRTGCRPAGLRNWKLKIGN